MGNSKKTRTMKILVITFLIHSFIALSVNAQEYLQYNTGDSSQIREDMNTLLTYQNWGEFKAKEPDFSLSYSKDKKDRRKYDSLSQIVNEKYFKGKDYRDERSWAVTRLLRKQYYYKELNNYKEQLIPSIWYDYIQYKGARGQYAKFLSLLDISQAKKDSLLEDKETPLAARARLGDKEAGQKIIERFNEAFTNVESPYFEDRFDLADHLLYIDTKSSLDAFFEMLGSNKRYYYEYSCNRGKCWTDTAIGGTLLWILSKYHPIRLFTYLPEELVGESIFIEKEHPKNPGKYYFDYPDRNMQPYYREVERLIKKLYNREVTINPPYWDRSLGPKLEEW
jgi:hypothetical protein